MQRTATTQRVGTSTATAVQPRVLCPAGQPAAVPCITKTQSGVAAASSNNGNGNGFVSAPTAVVEREHGLARPTFTPEEVFTCPEESLFYSQCLQRVFSSKPGGTPPLVVEFGTGDGSPVIDALLKTGDQFKGRVHGFELNPRAASVARSRCNQLGLNGTYHVHHSCFFKGAEQLSQQQGDDGASWLVANPPYLPAPDSNILMPELHGGVDGATLTNDLLSLGFPNAMLLISSYSNPLATLRHAQKLGYQVTDFLVTPLPFGYYSSEPKVKNWIREMKGRGEAFFCERRSLAGGYSNGYYLLAGVQFQKGSVEDDGAEDASEALTRVLTAL